MSHILRQSNRRRYAAALFLTGGVLAAPVFAEPQDTLPQDTFPTPGLIGFIGVIPNLRAVQIESDHVYDYTFSKAPVDWKVQSGVWEMTNRWVYSPGWRWFGGRSEEIAAIWNKRTFSGDFSAQFYFAFKAGLNGPRSPWQEHPADAAITVCGDGKNLGSGYSLILGADNNRHTILQKQGDVVAESTAAEALFVSYIDGRPNAPVSSGSAAPSTKIYGTTARSSAVSSPNYIQSHWWYAKINKIGNRIECWLDNKLLLAYDDPQPLDAGQFALWTYNNGIVLSRVQIFYENEVKPNFKMATDLAPLDPTLPDAADAP